MYKVKYTGSGRIEVDLPSYPTGVVIKHNDFAKLSLSAADKKVIKSLRNLGLSYEEIEPEKKVETVPVVDPAISEVGAVEAESAAVVDTAVEQISYTKEDLMRKTAGQLRTILKGLGVEDLDNKSKSEMSDKILEIVNGK